MAKKSDPEVSVRVKPPGPTATLDVDFTGEGEFEPLGETIRSRHPQWHGRGVLEAYAAGLMIMDLPPNELAVKLAARQEANAQAHAALLEQRLTVIEDKRMALAAHPAVPPEKRPI